VNEETTERIGVFGGSFDPVHMGHLTVAQDAVEQLELDRLIFVPAAVPPHKQDHTLADGEHRLAMLQLAAEDNPAFEVSDMELRRGGVSYTFETMQQVQAEHPGAEMFFIIGLDSLSELHLWRNIDELLTQYTVVPFARGGEDPQSAAGKAALSGGPVTPESFGEGGWTEKLMERLIRIHEIEISASEIRMRLAEGLSIRYLVPPEVEMYIFEHHLYG